MLFGDFPYNGQAKSGALESPGVFSRWNALNSLLRPEIQTYPVSFTRKMWKSCESW